MLVYFNVKTGEVNKFKHTWVDASQFVTEMYLDETKSFDFVSCQSACINTILKGCVKHSYTGQWVTTNFWFKSNDLISVQSLAYSAEQFNVGGIHTDIMRLIDAAKKILKAATENIRSTGDDFDENEFDWLKEKLKCVALVCREPVAEIGSLLHDCYINSVEHDFFFCGTHAVIDMQRSATHCDWLKSKSTTSVALVFTNKICLKDAVESFYLCFDKKHFTLDCSKIYYPNAFQSLLDFIEMALYATTSQKGYESLSSEGIFVAPPFKLESLTIYAPENGYYVWAPFFRELSRCKTLKRLKIAALNNGCSPFLNQSDFHGYLQQFDQNYQLVEISISSPCKNIKSGTNSFVSKICTRNRQLAWQNVKPQVVDLTMVLFGLVAPYVILEIFDWLPPSKNCDDGLTWPSTNICRRFEKITTIENVIRSIRNLKESKV